MFGNPVKTLFSQGECNPLTFCVAEFGIAGEAISTVQKAWCKGTWNTILERVGAVPPRLKEAHKMYLKISAVSRCLIMYINT